MQGAIAFSWPGVNIDGVQLKMQGIDHGGAENGAIDPGQKGTGGLEILMHQRLVQIMDDKAVFIGSPDHGQGRNADDANLLAAVERGG